MSRWLVLLLAVVVGASVANLYYAQPLLPGIADMLGVSDSVAGLLVTMSQVGYAAGLALLVPLGDLLERRRLTVGLLVATAAALGVAAAAPSFALLASAVAQIVVPMAASLAADDERGRVVGTVMSGLLIGILAARTVSGLIAAVGGWRMVFVLAAALMLAAPLAGRLADRGHARGVTSIALVGLLASWGLLFLGSGSVVLLLAGIVLLDLAQQTLQINHQSAIYTLGGAVRSRVTTAFMISVFLGGTIASAATAAVYAAAGWGGVSVLGAVFAAFALLFWIVTGRQVGGRPTPHTGTGVRPRESLPPLRTARAGRAPAPRSRTPRRGSC